METRNDQLTDSQKIVLYRTGLFVFLCTTVLLVATLLVIWSQSDSLKDQVSILTERNSMYTQIVEGDSVISYRVQNGRIITYRNLLNENDKLLGENNRLSAELDSCKEDLNIIQKNYPIKVLHKGRIVSVQAEEIDSALMLLNMYRDKITYNPGKKVWNVERDK